MAFFPIRTVSGKELDVAILIEARAKSTNAEIYSVIVPPRIKGFVIVEAPASYVIYDVIRGIKHVKGSPGRKISEEEITKLIKPVPVIDLIEVGDIVKLVAGPFKGMRARVEGKDKEKNEVYSTF